MGSFERTYSVVERSSEDSSSNDVTSLLRGYEEDTLSNEIFEGRENEAFTNEENPTSRGII